MTQKLVKTLFICGIILLLLISSLGCSSKTAVDTTDTTIIEVQYKPIDCGDLKLTGLQVQEEDITQHPGSLKNQKIVTHNLIILDYKLKEAQTILNCYKLQNQKLLELQSN